MGFVIFIFVLFILLIFIVIKSSILNFAFMFVLKDKIETERMALPIFLSIILLLVLILGATLILDNFNISVLNILYSIIMHLDYSLKTLGYVILAYSICIILFIFAEGAILKLISLPYSVYYRRVTEFIIKNKDKEIKPDVNVELVEKCYGDNLPEVITERKKLTYGQGLLVSLFSFSILFFLSILLIYIGENLGEYINTKYFS